MDTNIAYWLHPNSGVSTRGSSSCEAVEKAEELRCELQEWVRAGLQFPAKDFSCINMFSMRGEVFILA